MNQPIQPPPTQSLTLQEIQVLVLRTIEEKKVAKLKAIIEAKLKTN